MNKSKFKRGNAAEFLAQLEADPAYREMRERKDALSRELGERIRVSEVPLVQDLRAAGVKVSSVWDLVNTRASYAAAIPVLLAHFERDYIPEVREGIARALAVPEASWAWDRLLTWFRREPEGGPRNVKWALACALGGASTEDVIDTIIRLVRDPSLGRNRMVLLRALLRSRNPHARETLEQLRDDPDLKKELRFLLGRPKKKSE
ncbi:MAG TPA: hypothetical protein VEL79_22570 [Vicinamibacterales bacterium]|nr:hypothetical protein [Vicinamibacterales bacterium]